MRQKLSQTVKELKYCRSPTECESIGKLGQENLCIWKSLCGGCYGGDGSGLINCRVKEVVNVNIKQKL